MAMHNQPIRVIFVFACLDKGNAQVQLAHLARRLDSREFRFDAVVCFRQHAVLNDGCRELEALGVDIDCAPYRLGFDETVRYLAQKLLAYDIVVSCQNVADVYPALERLRWRPPLIEFGDRVSDALAGPKHFTKRYVGASVAISGAAATRMPGRAQDAVVIACQRDETHALDSGPQQWKALFRVVLAERQGSSPPSVFASFLQGGFECSTQRRRDGKRLDLIAATAHDANVVSDYRQLREHGMLTVRDGLRWHLIESGSEYDWSSFLPMLRAARQTGTQVIWDLMHYGWPDGLNVWSPEFVDRFARFAAATAGVVKSETDDIPFYCPINEISYLAWAGGDVAHLNPFAVGRSFELKAQLARASIAAMHAILHVEPRARFVHCEPVIHIAPDLRQLDGRLEAERVRQAQFQAFDMIAGTVWPQLGGEPRLLDITGVNYYRQNQWIHGQGPIDEQHRHYRPFRALLAETYARYDRPVLVAETGTEGDGRAAWFEAVSSEVTAARRAGIPVEGICLYPIIDHVGWDDDRYCPSGLLANRVENCRRSAHRPLAKSLAQWVRSA
jgi:hypothetical protein